jgi:flagellar capping protein FliD
MAHLEGAYEQLDKRLGDLTATMDGRFAQMDSRFAQIDSRFAQVDSRLNSLGQKVDGLQCRFTSLIVVTWITTILAVLLRH